MQPWQVRRAGYEGIVERLRRGDVSAGKEFDAVFTDFDTQVFARTPIENLEILGDLYIPKQGVDPALSVVVQNLVLGWYDALRFASESARAEIVNNEGSFKVAFIRRAGTDATHKAIDSIQSHPDRVHELIAQGIAVADKYKETTNYDKWAGDRRWRYGTPLDECNKLLATLIFRSLHDIQHHVLRHFKRASRISVLQRRARARRGGREYGYGACQA